MSHDSNNDYDCYIRRVGPVGWTIGSSHHKEALLRFLDHPRTNEEVQISVPHGRGGNFVAWFRRANSAVCRYRDETGQRVDIMMSSSGHANYINRIIDHV